MKKTKMWEKTRIVSLCAIGLLLVSLTAAIAKKMTIELNDAQVLKFDSPVAELFIVNPDIADVQLSNAHTAYVFGKTPGTTKLFAMDSKGKEVLNTEVTIIHDLSRLQEMISPFDPHGLVELRSVAGAIVLEGQAESPKTAEDIRSMAERFAGQSSSSSTATSSSTSSGTSGSSSTESSVINRLKIKAPVQVNLRVKVCEFQRSILNSFGINWQAAFANIGDFNFAALTGRSPFTALPFATNTVLTLERPNIATPDGIVNTLGANFQNGHVDLNTAIDLLSLDGLVTILAEPNLVAISGETANFLAGGEFPFPVPQQLGNITIDFKQYGVSLAFTPTVLDGRLISLRVRPEVSELDRATAIQVGGVSVPGILTRRAETTVELASGQTFAIAGLIKTDVTAAIKALPGLADLPILGPLFRSNSFQRGDTELVILVTPYLVEPSSGKEMVLPTDGLNYATFVEQIFERRFAKPSPQKGQAPAFGPGGVRLVGPAGFSVE